MKKDDWSAAETIAGRVLAEHDGVAKLASFLAAGLSAYQVAALLRRGVLSRPRSGWYSSPDVPWQAHLAVRVGGLAACISACDTYGLPVPPQEGRRIHVRLPANAPRVRHNRDRRHYVVPAEDREVVRHWSSEAGTPLGWRTGLVESLVDLARCAPDDWWVAAMDAALHRPRDRPPLLDQAGLLRLRELLPERTRRLLELVDPLAESGIETILRLGMDRRGIGPRVLQFVPHERYRCDFRVGRRILVEADGAAFHDPEADRVRDAFLTSLGYVILRFTYDDIVNDLDAVLDQIEAALAAEAEAEAVRSSVL